MSLSAKRSAYSDMPSVLSQSVICCIAVPSPAPLHRQHAEFNTPVASLKGSFLAGLMFLPGLLAIADEVTECTLSQCVNWRWRNDVMGHKRKCRS